MALLIEPAGEYILVCGWMGWSVAGLVCPGYPNCSLSLVAPFIEQAGEYRASSDTSCSVVGLAGMVTIGAVPETSEDKYKENRIYIRVEFRQSLGMNLVSPFQFESVQIM